jgi:hypothetical protein
MWTREDQPLGRGWPRDARVWLNPPFGPKDVLAKFMLRMAQHGNGISLLFVRTETAALFSAVWGQASAVLFLRGRVHFHRQCGQRAAAPAAAPVVLIAYGGGNASVLQSCGLAGKFIPLANS